MADEEVVVAVSEPIEVEETETKSPVASDLKRKLDDLEPEEEVGTDAGDGDLVKEELNLNSSDEVVEKSSVVPDAKKPRLEEEEETDGSVLENGHEVPKFDVPAVENDQTTTAADVEAAENGENADSGDVGAEKPQITFAEYVDSDKEKHVTVENTETENAENKSAEISLEEDGQKSCDDTLKTEDQHPPEGDLQQPESEKLSVSRHIEVPNNKVGVLIGKAGDTIRFLQLNSGAKIQITRDGETDAHSATRDVELIGTLENINKAEKLIKDVIAEADLGGSPSLVARGFGTVLSTEAADQIEIQVPNEKVGLIIGKGGETIKGLQTKSGARIQLIPQHLPEGDQSKERTVRVSGDKKNIDVAREMIKEVMNQPVRPSPLSGGHHQQGHRPRGSSGPSQWNSRAPPTGQGRGYDNQQRGMYPSQNPQYMQQGYSGYPPQQNAPRNHFHAGWDQRSGHMQTAPPQSGYDYYAHGGHGPDSSNSNPLSHSGPSPAPAAHGAPPANYNNYGQPQGPDYGQPTYPQQAPSQQAYGHGYEDPKYAHQMSIQPGYGGHGNAQPGPYPQHGSAQAGYVQQPYSKPPAYGMQPQGPVQSYGAPRAGHPGEIQYQNPAYGQTVPSQQPYPYQSGGPAHQAYPYTSAPAGNDGYNQPPTHPATAPVYAQPGAQPAPAYGQPGGQAVPGYAQGGQAGGYGSYASQPGYGEQPVPSNAGYGYQGPETGYAGAPASAYGAPPSAQVNYAQPAAPQPTYEQPTPQTAAYPGAPASAPGYAKNLSPQPAVFGQYDTTQMYGGQH